MLCQLALVQGASGRVNYLLLFSSVLCFLLVYSVLFLSCLYFKREKNADGFLVKYYSQKINKTKTKNKSVKYSVLINR